MGWGRLALALVVTAGTAGAASAAKPERRHARATRASFEAGTPARPPEHRRRKRDVLGRARRVTGRERPYHVAFTFDDGPSHETTPAVLAALARFGVPAAFFVVGRRISGDKPEAIANAAVLDDIRAAGHLIGNHTLRHGDLSLMTAAEASAAVAADQQAILRHTGERPALFRAPYGRVGAAAPYLRRHGMTVVGWSIDPRDFVEPKAASLPSRILAAIVRHKGGVVLLHDTHAWTAHELPAILGQLEAENCRRRADGERLIVPVSLHYFLRERAGQRRPVPPAVAARTVRYVKGLAKRCRRGARAVRARVDKGASPH
ncbi:MAG TPA: polysaccharide deacetylase family protein [Kofleriaceae bacterium]|nr:polysaccharide deacetylase family protein [Kofleriaceae bacterium]